MYFTKDLFCSCNNPINAVCKNKNKEKLIWDIWNESVANNNVNSHWGSKIKLWTNHSVLLWSNEVIFKLIILTTTGATCMIFFRSRVCFLFSFKIKYINVSFLLSYHSSYFISATIKLKHVITISTQLITLQKYLYL